MRKRTRVIVRRVTGVLLIVAALSMVIAAVYQQGGVEALLGVLIVIVLCVLGGVGAWLLLD